MTKRAGVVVGVVLASLGQAAAQRCPTINDVVAQVDPSQNLLLEFARAYGRSAGLSDLRRGTVAASEIEIRLWHGFGLNGVKGFVLQRTGGQWNGKIVAPIGRTTCYETRPVGPADWGAIWQQVEALGLAALPSTPPRDPNLFPTDGYSYVLEWREGERYRTFVYDNPDMFKTGEDRRMIAIVKHLLGAVGVRAPSATE